MITLHTLDTLKEVPDILNPLITTLNTLNTLKEVPDILNTLIITFSTLNTLKEIPDILNALGRNPTGHGAFRVHVDQADRAENVSMKGSQRDCTLLPGVPDRVR